MADQGHRHRLGDREGPLRGMKIVSAPIAFMRDAAVLDDQQRTGAAAEAGHVHRRLLKLRLPLGDRPARALVANRPRLAIEVGAASGGGCRPWEMRPDRKRDASSAPAPLERKRGGWGIG